MNSWSYLVENRKEKLQLFLKYSILKNKELNGKLPCCLPIESEINDEQLKAYGLSTGKRHFLLNNTLLNVLPLPIHQDVDITLIKRIINLHKNGR